MEAAVALPPLLVDLFRKAYNEVPAVRALRVKSDQADLVSVRNGGQRNCGCSSIPGCSSRWSVAFGSHCLPYVEEASVFEAGTLVLLALHNHS